MRHNEPVSAVSTRVVTIPNILSMFRLLLIPVFVVLLVLVAPFPPQHAVFVLILGGAVGATLGITIYSYVLWKQEKRA